MNKLPGRILLDQKQISKCVGELAQRLNKDYRHQVPVLIGVLNGSFIFMSDLVKQLTFAPKICFVQLSSYHGDIKSTGKIDMIKDVDIDVKGQSVVIVEDIVDTGLTVRYLSDYLYEKGAKPVKVCAFLSRSRIVKPDYVGVQLETNKFLVGYGLDLDNQFRNFPYVLELDMEANK